MHLLETKGLDLHLKLGESWVQVLDGVSLVLDPGSSLALVGESGCGKSLCALTLMGLVPAVEHRIEGSIIFKGRDLLLLSERERRCIRGSGIGLCYQDSSTALNPVLRIGTQLMEILHVHHRVSPRLASGEDPEPLARRMLERVGLEEPRRVLRSYPHQLSGGERQRVMLALALAPGPAVLLADEPTASLDVTVQAGLLDLLRLLCRELDLALLLITHDLAVAARTCRDVAVMYAGQIVETGPLGEVFSQPAHPYTRALLASHPSNARPGVDLPTIPGRVPNILRYPRACRFKPRCTIFSENCPPTEPRLTALPSPTGSTRQSRCHLQGLPL